MLKVFSLRCILTCVLLSMIWGTSYSQSLEKKVSINVTNELIRPVLDELENQGEITFVYDEKLLSTTQRISLNFKETPLRLVLDELCRKISVQYELKKNLVLLMPVRRQSAQAPASTTIQGYVKDVNNDPLPGVTVVLKGTNLGTTTAQDGFYRLDLAQMENITLVFSFVGMETQEIKYTGQDSINVVMKEDVKRMDEVVVTGYQAIQKKGMTGAYTKISGDELIGTGRGSVESMLQGRLPGVMVINESGLTGRRPRVRVRGTSTLLGNAEPVWVVDGIIQEDNLPFEAAELTNMGSNVDMMRDFVGGAISWLNPNDIEDITVLKDASATAIYGVKAANGVIVITTKKGERGRLSLNYSGDVSVSERMNYNRLEMMNSKERVALSREAVERGARVADEGVGYVGLAMAYARREITREAFEAGARELEMRNTNWFDVLYRGAVSHAHSVSFSGGDERGTYRVSLGYRQELNPARGNDQVTYTGQMTTTGRFWDRLTITASMAGSHAETRAFASGVDPYSYAATTNRALGCRGEDGELLFYNRDGFSYNILNELRNSGNENTLKSLTANVNARWVATEGLALSLTVGGTTSSSSARTWFTERSHYITKIRGYEYGEYGVLDEEFQGSLLPYGGMLTTSDSRNFNYTARLQGEWAKVLGGMHAVNVMAGVEARSNRYEGLSQTNWGYQPDRGESFVKVPVETPDGTLNPTYGGTIPTVTNRLSNYVSWYATAGYMYDERYSLNVSARGDASNAFGENSRFEPVWSVGARWNVTEEDWMRWGAVNTLSIMASVGFQGSVTEGVGPDLVARMLAVDEETGEFRMTWEQLPNPDLKWERTLSVNAGVDFSLLGQRLNGTFNWYYKRTTDVITSRVVPLENGTRTMYVNNGSMRNEGWELAVSVVPVRRGNFLWSLGTSLSGNTNRVRSRIEPEGNWRRAVDGTLAKEGYPVGSFWAFRFTGLDGENGKPLFDLSRANTAAAAEDATEYMVHVGTLEPTLTFGVNMMLRWKGFSLPLNVYVSRGNQTFLASPYENGYMMMSEERNASTELNDRWQKPGDEARTRVPSIPVGDNCRPLYPFEDGTTALYPLEAWGYSDARVVDAWYVRLNDLRLMYTLPEAWVKGWARSLSLSVTITNPLQIKSKDFKGRDPEVAVGEQPRSRDFSFGIDLSF